MNPLFHSFWQFLAWPLQIWNSLKYTETAMSGDKLYLYSSALVHAASSNFSWPLWRSPMELFQSCSFCQESKRRLMLPPQEKTLGPLKDAGLSWSVYFHSFERIQTSLTLLYCTHVFWEWQMTTHPTITCRLVPQESRKTAPGSAWTWVWAPSRWQQVTAAAACVPPHLLCRHVYSLV